MKLTVENIALAIRERRYRFEGECGTKATTLYVGRLEDAMLTALCDHHRLPSMRDATNPRRRRFEDLEVFTVDARSHLCVGCPDFPPMP